MSMKYIRDTYKVPAKRGMTVCWNGYIGRITSASNMLRVGFGYNRFRTKMREIKSLHPTYDIAYLLDDGQWVYTDVSQRTLTACKIYSEGMEF